MARYGMAIDLNRCFGCQACASACKVANNLPRDLVYNVVYTKTDDDYSTLGLSTLKGALTNDVAGGNYPDCTLSFLPFQCQHCEKPACLDVCPTGATQKREHRLRELHQGVSVRRRAHAHLRRGVLLS